VRLVWNAALGHGVGFLCLAPPRVMSCAPSESAYEASSPTSRSIRETRRRAAPGSERSGGAGQPDGSVHPDGPVQSDRAAQSDRVRPPRSGRPIRSARPTRSGRPIRSARPTIDGMTRFILRVSFESIVQFISSLARSMRSGNRGN
jgi:hypothetical protein